MTEKPPTKSKNFLDLLQKEIPYEYKLLNYKIARKVPEPWEYEIDDSYKFRNTVYVFENDKKVEPAKKKDGNEKYFPQYKREKSEISTFDAVKWENNIFDLDEETVKEPINIEMREYVNKLFETPWEEKIWYDVPPLRKPLSLQIDDPNLIFESIEPTNRMKKRHQKFGNIDKPLKNKYNLSNDRYYQVEAQTTGDLVSLGAQHSIPALKLSDKLYNINFTQSELMNWHRPSFLLEQNLAYRFSKPMQITFKTNFIRKLYEITCNDLSDFVICEYSEELPLFVSKPGMVSILINYYRKIDENDDFMLKNYNILEHNNENVFSGINLIAKGEKTTVIDCNLFTSPVFKHTSKDFLVIVTNNKLIFRKIPNIYVVGQELPKEEVFAPHSRKYNQFCRDRLKIFCHRIFSKKQNFSMEDLNRAFPTFTDGSKRKWIREYAESDRINGENVFVPRANAIICREDELRRLVSPENICQYESMAVDERRMESLGYKIVESEIDENEFIPNWILSRNFISAAQGKGLLEIEGIHEPTGVGEAMSYGKIRFGKANESDARRLFTEHQLNYRALIEKVIKKQSESLTKITDIPKPEIVPVEEPTPERTEDYISNKPVLIIIRYYISNGLTIEKQEEIYDRRVAKAYLRIRKRVKPEDKKASIKCSSCGGIGHMKTNKNCPNYQGSTKKKPAIKKKPILRMQDKISRLITTFSNVPYSSPFHRPVSHKKYPTYRQIIQNSIDFQTMRTKCRNGAYTTFDIFMDDVKLLVDNSYKFNGPTHSLTEIAESILTKAKSYKSDNFDELFELERLIGESNNA